MSLQQAYTLPARMLPVPHVGISTTKYGLFCPNNGVLTDASGLITPSWINFPVIRALNIPTDLLNPLLDLRVELMWYKAGKRKGSSGGVYRLQQGGYRHPATFDGNLLHTGDDTHNGSVNNVASTRISEWAVTARNQLFAVNLSSFLRNNNTFYFNSAGGGAVGGGGVAQTAVLVPSWMRSNRGMQGINNVKRINSRLQPLYVAFRYSIKNLVSGRGRVTGPMSVVLAASHTVAPFTLNHAYAYANNGDRAYNQNLAFNVFRMKVDFDRRIHVS